MHLLAYEMPEALKEVAHNNAAELSLTEFFRTRKKDGLLRRGSVDPYSLAVLPDGQDSQLTGPAAARSGTRIAGLLCVEGFDESGTAGLPCIDETLSPPSRALIADEIARGHERVEVRCHSLDGHVPLEGHQRRGDDIARE